MTQSLPRLLFYRIVVLLTRSCFGISWWIQHIELESRSSSFPRPTKTMTLPPVFDIHYNTLLRVRTMHWSKLSGNDSDSNVGNDPVYGIIQRHHLVILHLSLRPSVVATTSMLISSLVVVAFSPSMVLATVSMYLVSIALWPSLRSSSLISCWFDFFYLIRPLHGMLLFVPVHVVYSLRR